MNLLDIILIVILLLGALTGYRKGLMDQLLSLSVLVVALTCSKFLTPTLLEFTKDMSSAYAGQLAWLGAFILINIAGTFLRKLIHLSHGKGGIDGLLGALFSLSIHALVLSILLNFWVSWSEKGILPKLPVDSKVSPYILPLSKTFMTPDLLDLRKGNDNQPKEETPEQHII